MAEPIVTPTATPTPALGGTPPVGDLTKVPAPAAAKPPVEAVKPPTQAEIRKLKMKIDGKEEEITEEEAIVLAQKGKAADKRFQEAAAKQKEAEEVLEYIKQNPGEALKKLGLDPRKFSEEYLVEQLKREAETPEAKEIRETKEKLAAFEKKEAEREAAKKKADEEEAMSAKQRANAEKERQIIEKYDGIFLAALQKSGLPKNAYTVSRMAELQRVNLKSKGDFSADQLAKVVKEDYDAELKLRTSDMDGDKLIEMLTAINPDILKKITKAQIAKLKGKQTFTAPTDPTPPPSTEKPLTWREFTRKSRQAKTS